VKISVIIPCYNEEAVLAETYRRLAAVMAALPHDYELIFVNDGSCDSTGEILRHLADCDPRVKALTFSRNFGHQCAITAGLNFCAGAAAVLIDADLQDPPELIPDMLALMASSGANHVYAVRRQRAGDGRLKLALAKAFYRVLNSLSDTPLPVDTGDFRLVDRAVIDTFNRLDERNKYVRGLMSWIGFKQSPFYYDRAPRAAGTTKYPFRKSLRLGLTGIFYFSKKPLNLAVLLGFLCLGAGLFYAGFVLWQKIYGAPGLVSGWSSLVCLITFFSGVQLLTAGILGKYIGSLFDEAKRRPEYIVSGQLNFDTHAKGK
jgi:dolichol-phosphate mannosyltransferase